MVQPRKVREAARRAEEAHRQAYGNKNTPPPKDEDRGEAATESPALQVVEDQPELPEPAAAPQAAPVTEQQPPQKAPEPASSEEDTLDYWKRRALTREGIEKKVADENRQLRQDVAELRGAMATLTQMQQKAAPAPQPSSEPPKQRSLLKPEEINDYGEDLIDVMKRAAREAVQQEIDAVRKENVSLRERLDGMQTQTAQRARNDVYGTLQDKVPNWQEINTDPDFLQWLGEQDYFSGKPRGSLLQEAFEGNDAARVVRFFESFLREHQTVTPDPQSDPQAQPTRQPAQTLDTMVAPGKPRGGAASAQGDQKRIWSQKEIHDFYQKVHHGKYRGKEKEQRAIEQDIIAATKEGRIRL